MGATITKKVTSMDTKKVPSMEEGTSKMMTILMD